MDYYTLDRTSVAKMLNVSTRTLDRYIAKKIFSTEKKNGKIYFHSKEIEDFLSIRNTESIDNSFDNQSTRLRHIKNSFSQVFSVYNDDNFVSKDVSTPPQNDTNTKMLNFEAEAIFYKKMYETIQDLFKAQQGQLQGAYYRIGQIEAQLLQLNQQINNSIPLLEVEKEKIANEASFKKSEVQIKKLEDENYLLEKRLEVSVAMKIIYTIFAVSVIFIASFLFAIN